jgi:Xaa-Pro dipeptidase
VNLPDRREVILKEKRIREYLCCNGYDAMIIGRQDNFSWFTDGGNSRVIIPSEFGFSILVVTMDKIYLVSQVMDGKRVTEEELSGLDVEYVPLYWYEISREEKAMSLVKGGKIISDIPLPGVHFLPKEIYNLHYPLTDLEIKKLSWLGEKSDEVMFKVAEQVTPGVTEHEIEAMFLYEYGKENVQCDVLLVGSDERIFKYRHPNPSDKKVDKYVLLHTVARKWGLHCNVTRLMYFGDTLSEDISRKYEAASIIEAAAISMCNAGTRFSDILSKEKKLYKEFGYEDEWRNHYQGGITGYIVADPTLCNEGNNIVSSQAAYDWFITITGVKVEELSINKGNEQSILSVTGKWPTREYRYDGKAFNLPVILCR